MQKEFNITGTCFKEDHYMMDNSKKINAIAALIKRGKYFTINRPRQYGKTTTLYTLTEFFLESEEYLLLSISFESLDDSIYQNNDKFCKSFLDLLIKIVSYQNKKWADYLKEHRSSVSDLFDLSNLITDFIKTFQKKVILLIDEVDSSGNYTIFLKFLAMLRAKYLNRKLAPTFHSIVLAGVHDVKTLKYKMPHRETATYNSPWNIAIDFKVTMSFDQEEIATMLKEYKVAEKVTMNIPTIAKRIHYHTSGYPFLVSKICKTVAEDILPTKITNQWNVADIEEAARLLVKENNTNFDSLIKNLENNEPLYRLVYDVVISGETISFNAHDPIIHLGVLYGIFKNNGILKIHNRIYTELITNYMISKTRTSVFIEKKYSFSTAFKNENKTLNLEKVLLKFQQFMKEQYSGQDQSFVEREWRLIFLAFLKPIINGKGHDFKEPQISDEKRLDVVVTYLQHKYVIELKRWNGAKLHQEGIKQLNDYLDRQHLTKGFLLIFEYRTKKTWRREVIKYKDKEIFAVWV